MSDKQTEGTAFGRLAPEWKKLFPPDEFQRVMAFVVSTWSDLAKRNMPNFHLKRPEPRLTKYFKTVLESQKIRSGILGHFASENVGGDADLESGDLLNEKRTDLQFFSARTDLSLTMEFKKLRDKNGSRKSYYGFDGMLRFVSSKYAQGLPIGIMIGLVGHDKDEAIQGLLQALGKPAIQSELHMLPDLEGKKVRKPSTHLPMPSLFDTEHSRAALNGSGEIVLCHIFLETPEGPQ